MHDLTIVDRIEHRKIWLSQDPRFRVLYEILKRLPNTYWKYPIYTYLLKMGKLGTMQKGTDDVDVFVPFVEDYQLADPTDTVIYLDPKYHDELALLMLITALYMYTKGIVYGHIGAVRGTIYEVCKSIWHDGTSTYLDIYRQSLKIGSGTGTNDIERLMDILKNNPEDLGKYLRGLVLLIAYLHTDNVVALAELVSKKWDIEHILPKKWRDYEGWDEETWERDLNRLGNLVPLDKVLNIRASNEYFKWKKNEYRKSLIADVQDLCKISDWTPAELDKRDEEMLKRLENELNRIFVVTQKNGKSVRECFEDDMKAYFPSKH